MLYKFATTFNNITVPLSSSVLMGYFPLKVVPSINLRFTDNYA